MFSRWMIKPHFASKETILQSAIKSFLSNEPIACLKIILTEIEGILSEAYIKINGKSAKIDTLLAFAIDCAQSQAGANNTLLLPASFARYLDQHTFANFDPITKTGHAGSRHAVGHGAAGAESYTTSRALQAILTLDQLAFYT